VSGCIDGVSKVWTARADGGGALHLTGYPSKGEAAIGLMHEESYRSEWLAQLIEHRAKVTRLIRNERRLRKKCK
jgi:hypothetical protein